MKRTVLITVIVLLLCMSGCSTERTYTFMQPQEEIVSIDLIYVDPYSDYSAYNSIEAIHTIPVEQWTTFFEEFDKVTCKRHGMDPCYSTSGTIIRIIYADGGYEVISAYTGLHISADGEWEYTSFYFDETEFKKLIAKTEDGSLPSQGTE